MKRRHLPESTWAEIRTSFASGLGLREVARNMGVPAGSVLSRAKRENWTRRIEAVKADRQPVSDSPPVAVSDAVALSMAERGQRHVERMASIVERVVPHVEGMESGLVLEQIDAVDRLDRIGRRTYGLDDHGSAPLISIALLSMAGNG